MRVMELERSGLGSRLHSHCHSWIIVSKWQNPPLPLFHYCKVGAIRLLTSWAYMRLTKSGMCSEHGFWSCSSWAHVLALPLNCCVTWHQLLISVFLWNAENNSPCLTEVGSVRIHWVVTGTAKTTLCSCVTVESTALQATEHTDMGHLNWVQRKVGSQVTLA